MQPGQGRHRCAANAEGEQGFIDLFAGAQGLAIGLVRAPQGSGFTILHPDKVIGAIADNTEDLIAERAGVSTYNIRLVDGGGTTMGNRDHHQVIFEHLVDGVIVSLADSRI